MTSSINSGSSRKLRSLGGGTSCCSSFETKLDKYYTNYSGLLVIKRLHSVAYLRKELLPLPFGLLLSILP